MRVFLSLWKVISDTKASILKRLLIKWLRGYLDIWKEIRAFEIFMCLLFIWGPLSIDICVQQNNDPVKAPMSLSAQPKNMLPCGAKK